MMLGNSLPISSCRAPSQTAPLEIGAQHSEVATVAMNRETYGSGCVVAVTVWHSFIAREA